MRDAYSIPLGAAVASARPLLFVNDARPEYPISIGPTCFLIRFKSRPYVVTSEHGLIGQQRDLREVRVGIAADSLTWLPLRNAFGFPRGSDVQQSLDFLIYSVDEEALSSRGHELPTLPELALDEIGEIGPSGGRYRIVGFPSSGKGIDYSERRVRVRREIVTGHYDRWDERRGCHRLRLDALPIGMTTIQGMSGSPVFTQPNMGGRDDLYRLVGVAIVGGIESMSVGFMDINRIAEFMDCLF